MQKVIDWIKNNKLAAILLLITGYYIFHGSFKFSNLALKSRQNLSSSEMEMEVANQLPASVGGMNPNSNRFHQQPAPVSDVEERLVVKESNISLLVEDVRETSDKIINYAEDQGGYMVSSSITQPQEAPYAQLALRIPSAKLKEILDYFRSLAIKVTSEKLIGRDISDEYEDIEARLATLIKTKARFEKIMEQAVKIDDILRVQREIINLQRQIDSLKGRQQYLRQTAKLAKVTIYMSTDEIALPYAPSETFRPKMIAKMAIRSLIKNLRKVVAAAIWIVIYSLIWLPVLAAVIFVRRWLRKRKAQK